MGLLSLICIIPRRVYGVNLIDIDPPAIQWLLNDPVARQRAAITSEYAANRQRVRLDSVLRPWFCYSHSRKNSQQSLPSATHLLWVPLTLEAPASSSVRIEYPSVPRQVARVGLSPGL